MKQPVASGAGRTRRGTNHATGALLVVFTIGLLATIALTLGGYRPLIVMSGSMAPTLQPGDVAVSRIVDPGEVSIGDIVTFRDPTRSDRLVTHRVAEAARHGERVDFVTRGDTNTGVERWGVAAEGSVGSLAFRVPKAGYLLAWAADPRVRTAVMLAAVCLLGASALRRIWAE